MCVCARGIALRTGAQRITRGPGVSHFEAGAGRRVGEWIGNPVLTYWLRRIGYRNSRKICSALLGGSLLSVAAKVAKSACLRIRAFALLRLPSLRCCATGTHQRAILAFSTFRLETCCATPALDLLNGAFGCHRNIRATMLNVNRRVDNRAALSTKDPSGGKAASGVFHPAQMIR